MREQEADLWTVPADWRVITVNRHVKKDGRLVMGRGVAKEAQQRYRDLDLQLGAFYKSGHLRPFVVPEHRLIAYPVKPDWHSTPGAAHHPGWQCGSRHQSAWCRLVVLQEIVRNLDWFQTEAPIGPTEVVAMPRLGCGWGGLDWNMLRPILADVLDDRFIVVSLPGKERA